VHRCGFDGSARLSAGHHEAIDKRVFPASPLGHAIADAGCKSWPGAPFRFSNQSRDHVMSALQDLFSDQLKDIYYAEKQIYKTLPKMMKKASSPELKAAFEKHRGETEGQIERLEKVFELLNTPAKGKKCAAIDGILEEGSELMDEYDVGPGLDSAMAAAAQAVEHYEIARYGTLLAWSRELGMKDAGTFLEQTLQEEEATDTALSKLAVTKLNSLASAEDEPNEDEGSDKPMSRSKRKKA
jgi:ferritin-like metal-binding protein YciE